MAADWSADVVRAVERWAALAGGPGLDALRDGLRAAGPAPLARALVQRRLAGPPTARADAAGLRGAQVEAYRACLSPGVRLVWGPPGTGPTEVLARAIEALVADGERVLLVSATDAAVDDVLAVVRRTSPGQAIRVGPAQRAEIADDPDVQLELLAARASREVDEERDATAAQLGELADLDVEVGRLRAELRDDEAAAYEAAVTRLAAEREAEELRGRLLEVEAVADGARRAAVSAATALREALADAAELERERDALEQHQRALDGLAALEQRRRALRLHRDALDAQEPPAGWRARRQHRRDIAAAEAELRRFSAVAADGRRRWLDVQLRARALLGPDSRADVERADRRVAAAEAAVAAADEEYRRTRDLLAGLRAAIAEAEARGAPTDDDRRLVAESDARGLSARHARLSVLVARQQGTAARRRSLEARHRELAERARALRADAEARLVRDAAVVATTLARSRSHPALAAAEFGVVLVADAGAAPLAEVLLALCRATTTAVLCGDVLRPGSLLDPAVQGDSDPDLQRWVCGTAFSHLGIGSAADVAVHAGCVALTPRIPEQRRTSSPAPAASDRT